MDYAAMREKNLRIREIWRERFQRLVPEASKRAVSDLGWQLGEYYIETDDQLRAAECTDMIGWHGVGPAKIGLVRTYLDRLDMEAKVAEAGHNSLLYGAGYSGIPSDPEPTLPEEISELVVSAEVNGKRIVRAPDESWEDFETRIFAAAEESVH